MGKEVLANADRAPALDRQRFNCPACGAFADQAWSPLAALDADEAFEYLGSEPYTSSTGHLASRPIWNGAQCASCSQWSIWFHDDMVYPRASVGAPAHPDMPGSARELYIEAAAVAQVSRRAGAAMARAAVERVIKEVDPEAPKKANLDTRIARLKGRVSTPLGRLLDVVRVTGNSALHQSDDPSDIVVVALDDKEGPAVLAVILQVANDLVDELITRPRVATELWEKIPKSIRERSSYGTGVDE